MCALRKGTDCSRLLSRCAAICAVGALLFAQLAQAADQARVYRVQHLPAAELLPIASASLGEQGSAVARAGTLVLVGPDAAVGRTLELLQSLDLPPRMLTLTLEAASLRALRTSGRRVLWSDSIGSLQTGLLEKGIRIAEGVGPASRSITTSRDQSSRYSIRVQDGGVARLELGRLQERSRAGLFYSTTTILQATSGLLAKPEILGDGQVALTLDWADGRIVPGGEVIYSQLQTTVRAQPGQVVVLGNAAQRGPQSSARRFSTSPANAELQQVILLHVAID